MSGSAPTSAADTMVLGRVVGAFGIRGWIKVKSFTQSADGLLTQPNWALQQSGVIRNVRVAEARPHGMFVVAQLEGVADRGQAEGLRGADVTVHRDQLPEPGAGEYYWSDLIGLSVRNMTGVDLGRVTGLIEAPAHDVLRVVAAQDGGQGKARERLIPFAEPIVRAVDLAGGCITVDWEADY